MATHSSILAWKISWTEEPGGVLQSMGSQRVGHDRVTNACLHLLSLVQSLNRVQLCNPVDCRMLGFPVHQQLPELAQTHVHRVGDAIQQSHPLSSPSPPAINLSQHQGLFQ